MSRSADHEDYRGPVTAIILAGGVGLRAGDHGVAKQYVRVAGKPILQHTLEIFQRSASIDEIVLVADSANTELIEKIIVDGEITKLVAIVAPGATRNESTCNALAVLGPEERKILIHDGVRPLLEQQIITRCLQALDDFDAVDVVITSADTLVEVDDNASIVAIPNRSHFRRGQTPQGFRLSTLRTAYQLAADQPSFPTSDDCAVVLNMLPEVVITTVEGSETNMKITYPQDYLAADQLFRLRAQSWQPEAGAGNRPLTGHNYVVFGGSRGIGRAVADSLVEHGAQVVSASRQSGLDIRQQSEVRHTLERAYQELGSIDGVIVTAGVLSTGALASMSEQTVSEMIDTNLVGSALVAQAAHPYLCESRGTLVLFGSSSYTRGRGGYAIYSATKAAIVNLTQALADEWAVDNIRVNCVSPARTATEMRQKSNLDDADLLSSDQVAGATVALLCSDITGTVLNVDRRTVARELAPWNDAAVARSARYLQA